MHERCDSERSTWRMHSVRPTTYAAQRDTHNGRVQECLKFRFLRFPPLRRVCDGSLALRVMLNTTTEKRTKVEDAYKHPLNYAPRKK